MTTDLMALIEQGWNHPFWVSSAGFLWASVVLALWAFLAATVLPIASEAALLALAFKYPMDLASLCIIATVGNTLGGVTTLMIGRWASSKKQLPERWKNSKAIEYVQRWGTVPLLFSGLPILGDAIVFAGGWFKLPWTPSILALGVGKFVRYATFLWAIGA